ncbi:protein ITPRID2 [Micropterus dolomieu]|uniref:protein ITPRID2 n=1 Tax=Micropterus dolomieu TaxID=147949 RepID=UPI001E8EC43A|nr:protein ITPRID2 [Micropterus dolomieu]XP_045931613.1 protein ITPRID2 [Micropterus dolomieu]XP_045931614.1 protein ITPRID2 [Micropterus dolomieu]XP_045931615.1 protein ITPRID2 [Micropterus dolomieu]XP_045931616.1 protein ITPRID2 [Micropterus dolomieu]
MESPSSTVRRRAWINSRRQWLTLEELDPDGPPCNLPSASIADDDVFSDGCFTGKIENWLQGCGLQARSENGAQLSFESVLNFDDELSLGADASALNGGQITSKAGLSRHLSFKQCHSRPISSTPRQALCLPSLNLGNSMASSCLSSSTCKTTSSISEILQLCSEDAEETLYELGFGCDEPQVTVRIPPRFFTFPSQAQGINFRLFLDSQLRRIREEDPSLSLASRFRQVQVLTAMANAFYSLYSHVSRTPLQKLATPEFTFSSPVERIERFRSSVRSEPRSPVERLKDTVSKMCLYTGSPRGSESTSPQPSPRKRSSLPDVVDIVLDKVKTGASKKLDLGECNRSNSAVDVRLVTDDDRFCNSGKEEKTQETVADADTPQDGSEICHNEMQGSKLTDNADADENSDEAADLDSRTHSVRTSIASSLSGETVIETDYRFLSRQPDLDSCSTQSDTETADLKPVAKVTYDLICPQIIESVHQVPFCCQHTCNPKTSTLPPMSSETESIDSSCPVSHEPHIQTDVSELDEDSHTVDDASSGKGRQLDAFRSLPVLATQCCITVSGWDGDDVSSSSLNAPDSSHTPTFPPAQSCKEYLKPLAHQGPGNVSNNLQQVNSFELEEVHSAGEEDFGHLESSRTTSPLSKKRQYKGEVIRGDSVQSDSSGYADEEVSPSSSTHGR